MGNIRQDNVIIESIALTPIQDQFIPEVIEKIQATPKNGDNLHPGYITVGKGNSRNSFLLTYIKMVLQNPNEHFDMICRYYLSFNTLVLGGENRINMVGEQAAADLQQPP